MSKIPTKVEEQEREAEELLKKLEEEYSDQNQDDIPSREELVSDDLPDDNSGDAIVPDNTQLTNPTQPKEDWEHKYKVLQGKYDSEVPVLNQQIKLLMNQVEILTKKLEEMSASTESKDEAKNSNNTAIDTFNLQEFIEQYPEIYSAIEKVVETKYNEKVSKLEEKLNETTKVTSSIAQSKFYDDLTRLVPDWKDINVSSDFMEWVNEVEPFSGLRKYDLLMNKYNKGDAEGVAYFFNRYKSEKGLASKTTQTAQQKLKDFVAPEPAKNKVQFTGTPQYKIDDLNIINKQLREALARRDYKKADELEKKIDEILLNLNRR